MEIMKLSSKKNYIKTEKHDASLDKKEMFCKLKCSNKTYLLKSLIL